MVVEAHAPSSCNPLAGTFHRGGRYGPYHLASRASSPWPWAYRLTQMSVYCTVQLMPKTRRRTWGHSGWGELRKNSEKNSEKKKTSGQIHRLLLSSQHRVRLRIMIIHLYFMVLTMLTCAQHHLLNWNESYFESYFLFSLKWESNFFRRLICHPDTATSFNLLK